MPGTSGVRSRHPRAGQTLASSRVGADAASAAGAGRRPRRHASTTANTESTSAAPERISGRIEPDTVSLWVAERDLLVLPCLAALVSRRGALLRCGRRNGEYRGRVLGLDRRVSRNLIPVHFLAAGVGLEGVEHQPRRTRAADQG